MEKPSTREILLAWKSECGEWRRGDGGTKFQVMSAADLQESFQRLYKTLTQNGYTREEIDSPHLSKMIVDICWREDKIRKMSNSEVRQAKKSLAEDWDEFIHSSEMSGIVIATLEEGEKIVPVERIKTEYKKEVSEPTKEELLKEILEPSNRLLPTKKIDRRADIDFELLAELGIEPDGSENE